MPAALRHPSLWPDAVFLSVSLLHRCTHRRTYLLWFQTLSRFEMWIPFQSSPFDHSVIFSPFCQCWHIYSAAFFTFSCSCPHLLWLCSSIWITTPVFPSSHLLTPPGFPVGKRESDRQKGGTGWDRGDRQSVCEKPPGVGNSPAKTPRFPRFSSSVCTVSALPHRVSSSLSLASSFSPSPSFLTSLTPPLCPSVSLIILHCFTCNVVRH